MKRTITAILVVAWCAGVGIGLRLGLRHATAAVAGAPSSWPAASNLVHSQTGPTIVMFVAPESPCARTTLRELAEVVRAHSTRTIVVVEAWPGIDVEHGPTWSAAEAVPDATRYVDRTGVEAARFGARTSGFAVAYDAHGALRFSGGILAAPADAGYDAGRRMLASSIVGVTHFAERPVFGCAPEDPR